MMKCDHYKYESGERKLLISCDVNTMSHYCEICGEIITDDALISEFRTSLLKKHLSDEDYKRLTTLGI